MVTLPNGSWDGPRWHALPGVATYVSKEDLERYPAPKGAIVTFDADEVPEVTDPQVLLRTIVQPNPQDSPAPEAKPALRPRRNVIPATPTGL